MQSTHIQMLEVIGEVPPLRMKISVLNPWIPHFGLFFYWTPTSTGAGSSFKVEFFEDSSEVQRGRRLLFGTSSLSL
jgi:hypothetical protein